MYGIFVSPLAPRRGVELLASLAEARVNPGPVSVPGAEPEVP